MLRTVIKEVEPVKPSQRRAPRAKAPVAAVAAQPVSPESRARQRHVAIGLAVLFALGMLFLGATDIYTQVYTANSKHGPGRTIYGVGAQWMGGAQICLGMVILAIAMPNRVAAAGWAVWWLTLSGTAFYLALQHL